MSCKIGHAAITDQSRNIPAAALQREPINPTATAGFMQATYWKPNSTIKGNVMANQNLSSTDNIVCHNMVLVHVNQTITSKHIG